VIVQTRGDELNWESSNYREAILIQCGNVATMNI